MIDEILSAEDRYAQAVELLTEKPAEATTVAATPEAAAPQAQAQAEGRTRNADGTFAPVADKGAPAAQREPFAGFNDLPEEAKLHFNRLTGRTVQLEKEQKALAGRIAPLQRELQSLRTRAPEQSAATTRQQAQQQLDKWDAHAKQYPEDAEAIGQLTSALRAEIQGGLGGLNQKLTPLEARLAALEGWHKSQEDDRHKAASLEHQATLTEVAGDNWKQIAGWEDENGHPIPREQQQWHPEFMAWIDGHEPDMASHYREVLRHSSPRVVGNLIASFNRDRFELDNGAQPAATSQRSEALRDVTPSASGRGKPAPALFGQGASPEDQFASQMEAIDQWQKSRKR